MEICKIAFFCEYQYLGFLKSQQRFSGALEFSFVFKFLLQRLKNTALGKKVKIDFLGEKCLFGPKITFFENCSIYPVEAEKLIFQTKWVVFAPKQFAKSHTDKIKVLFINLGNS